MNERPGVLVGRTVTVISTKETPGYFTGVHRKWLGKRGRIHAVVGTQSRQNPLIKVGFNEGEQIVFYRLSELKVHRDEPASPPRKHGKRGSHLPKAG